MAHHAKSRLNLLAKTAGFLSSGLVLLALGMAQGCDSGAPVTPGADPVKPGEGDEPAAMSGKVASIRSASGGIEGLSARGPAGQRSLAPGDDFHAGETVEADAGLEAVLALGDDSALVLSEKSRVSLPGEAGSGALAVEAGRVSVSRPLHAGGRLPIAAAGTRFGLVSGRATVDVDESGEGRLSVEAGEVSVQSTGERLRAGQTVSLAAGAVKPVVDHGVAGFGRAYPTGPIQPLAPEYTYVPRPQNLLRGIGTLSAREPRSGRTNERALQMVRHDVDVTIRDGVAQTRIEEAFVNNSSRTVEATYKFLIPSGASITRLALEVNGRIEEGEVLDKRRAKRIFRQIVEDSVRPRDPALLEWERGSSFSMKIFPVKAGETRRVFISYMEPMTAVDGAVRYVYPLGGPAGSPDIGEFSFDADIGSPAGIRTIRTPLYPTEIQATGDRATVSFEASDYAPSADLVLEYATREKPAPVRVAVETEKDGRSYAMALVRPDGIAGAPPSDSRLLLLIDTSYGIGDDLRALSNSIALELAAGLGTGDSFNVLACDSGCRPLFAGFQKPSADALARMNELLSSTEPGGASDILGAIEHAYAMSRDGVPTSVVYIGDGIATSGETDPGELLDILERTRPANVAVQAVGIGPDVDSVLLDAMAASLGGSSYRLSVGESPATAAWNVARKMRSEGIRDVVVEWPAGIEDGYPKRVGFVPAGSEIVLTASLGRSRTVSGEVVVRGKGPNGAPWEKRFSVSAPSGPPAPGFISKLWAKERIEALELEGGRGKEIVKFSGKMRVASRLTSWLVLENERMYKRFKVERTDAEEWDGAGAVFTEVEKATEEEAEEAEVASDDMDLDALVGKGTLGDVLGGSTGTIGAGSGYGRGGGGVGKSAGADIGTAAQQPAPRAEDRKAERAREASSKKSRKSASSEALKRIAGEPMPEAAPASPVASSDSSALNDEDEYAGAIASGLATAGPIEAKEKSGYRDRPYHRCGYTTVHEVDITRARGYGSAARSRARKLGSEVEQRPLSRAMHKKYVRVLARIGDLDALAKATEAWRSADPMGTEALGAYADQLARMGDRSRAARMYASIAELKPGSKKIHLRLAAAFRDLGDYGAAAGHYRAAADAKRGKDEHMLDYLFCLAASGQLALLDMEAASVMASGKYRKIHREVNDLMAGTRSGVLPAWPARRLGGGLTIRLDVDQPGADLDLAVIDPAGRRISGLWRRTASVKDLAMAGNEEMSVSSIWNGRWRILVTRSDGSSLGTYTGRLVIKLRDKRKTIPFTLSGPEEAVAQVRYKKSQKYSCR